MRSQSLDYEYLLDRNVMWVDVNIGIYIQIKSEESEEKKQGEWDGSGYKKHKRKEVKELMESLIQEESLTSGLHDALKDNDNLKLFVHERALG